MANEKKLGIYIHIPFCIKKCGYCDFCSFSGVHPAVKDDYVSILCLQIKEALEMTRGYAVDTVYFGGGTPTLLAPDQFERIFEALNDTFCICKDAEITSECNPATADRKYFSFLRGLGINRLSIGVQSTDPGELKALGRAHGREDIFRSFEDAHAAGFENLSADLMFGIPGQTRGSFGKTLCEALTLGVSHISAYGLILEPGTEFYKNREKLALPDEDTEYTMYKDAVGNLSAHGFKRYEISNFAIPGRESRHNLKYWRREEYLGFGASAHSFFGERRFSAPTSIKAFNSGRFEDSSEHISRHDAACEFVMLGMRLAEGFAESELEERFGISADELFRGRLEKYIDDGFVVRKDGRCAFSDEGFYVSNTVLSDILDFDS